MTYDATAAERVKTSAPIDLRFLQLGELHAFMKGKGFPLPLVTRLAELGAFGPLFADLVLRSSAVDVEALNDYGLALSVVPPAKTAPYLGTDAQNGRIDRSIANSGITQGNRQFGQGAATLFTSRRTIPRSLAATPIAVIGYGAAGIMVTAALRTLGFRNITVYEKLRPLGIWSTENVYGLSRNNPRRLEFYGKVLEAAPGGGDEVRQFLANLVAFAPHDATVVGVEPGRPRTTIRFADGRQERFPIVINAGGLGKPKGVSDPKRMTTTTGQVHAGLRWQQRLEPAKIAGKRLILIGLGNSTAEMLRQIHTIEDAGYDVDYRVLTHYPEEAVFDPSASVEKRGRTYRVFRDVSRPNLVDFQGDLPQSRYDYFRALHKGRILCGILRWEIEAAGLMSIYRTGKNPVDLLPYDRILTLIGYKQPEETMREMGCSYDEENECGRFDYDGELIAVPNSPSAAKRLHRGCYGFGSILETPENPNAIVIPGMMHRIGDLLFSIIMRAAEFNKKEFLA